MQISSTSTENYNNLDHNYFLQKHVQLEVYLLSHLSYACVA